jgi:hypothetical protein
MLLPLVLSLVLLITVITVLYKGRMPQVIMKDLLLLRRVTPAATWDQVAAAAIQPPPASGNVNASAPEALFHLLDKTLLLKDLMELKAEKTVNVKPFYKSYVEWEDLNQTQRNKTISFWVSHLTDGVRFAIKILVEADQRS